MPRNPTPPTGTPFHALAYHGTYTLPADDRTGVVIIHEHPAVGGGLAGGGGAGCGTAAAAACPRRAPDVRLARHHAIGAPRASGIVLPPTGLSS